MAFQDTPILVIDDSTAVRTVLKDVLAEKGFTDVTTAASVAEAQTAFETKHHPIVFLDLLMPEASGLRFARYALDLDPYCKIVLITALPPTNEGVITAVSEGAYDVLQKPIRPAELLGMMRKLEKDTGTRLGPRDDVSYT